MSNVLEFFVKMKDMMSSGLVRMAATAQTSFARVQNNINATTAANNRLASSVDDVSRRMERSGTSAAGWAKKIAVAAVATGALSFATNSIKAAMNYGATQKSFEVLTGSPDKGKQLSGDLNKLQQQTILGPEVFKNAQTMMSFGITADKVLPSLKMLGDISMGDAEKLSSLTLAFSQVTAAGKLSGQDMLQFVNAGFNPLKEISDRTGESMMSLKKKMEAGGITTAMVEQSFKTATSTGGKFNGMMDQIAETSFGRLQVLEGQFESFKIGVGEALMPVAESLMDVATKTLDWIGITKTAPEVLMAESAGIRGLVGMITSLNEGNDTRRVMIETLMAKYPEFFGGLDKEKVKNAELLEMVSKVNAAYKDRIDIASSQLISDTNEKIASESMADYLRLHAISEAYKSGDTEAAKAMQTFGDWLTTAANGDAFEEKSLERKGAYDNAVAAKNRSDQNNQAQKNNISINQMMDLVNNPMKAAAVFKDRIGTDFTEFVKLGRNPSVENFAKMQELVKGGAVGAGSIKGGAVVGASKETKQAADGAVRGIASGGPRTININGVKFAETIYFEGGSGKDPLADGEDKLKEMFLRVLNSGATVS